MCKTNSIRHPAANQTERYIKEVNEILRILTKTYYTSWENHIKEVQVFFNNIPSTILGENPIYVIKG